MGDVWVLARVWGRPHVQCICVCVCVCARVHVRARCVYVGMYVCMYVRKI